MSFHLTCTEIRIEIDDGATYLHALGQSTTGTTVKNRFRLDDVLGNNDGEFEWGGENFTSSAKDITLEFEPYSDDDDGLLPILKAMLEERAGTWCKAEINLAEQVENQDGVLNMLG